MKRLVLLLTLVLTATVFAGNFLTKNREFSVSVVSTATGADSTMAYDTTSLGEASTINTLRYTYTPLMTAGPRGSLDSVVTTIVIKSRVGEMYKTIDSQVVELPDTLVGGVLPAAGDSLIFGELLAIVVHNDTASDSIQTITFSWRLEVSGKDN